MEAKIILGITTLHYEKQCVDALLRVADAHVVAGFAIPDGCLLPQARNKAVEMAYEMDPEFTHMLFVDDDMCGFTENHILKLLEDTRRIPECDIVSALVTLRAPPYKIVAQFPTLTDKEILEGIKAQKVMESEHTGMAFTLITRHVLDAMKEETDEGPIWFTLDRLPRANYEFELKDYINDLENQVDNNIIKSKDALYKAAAFGEQAHRGARIPGEDIEFCYRAHKFGFKTWIDCGVPVGHLGIVGFDFRHAFLHAAQNSNANAIAVPE